MPVTRNSASASTSNSATGSGSRSKRRSWPARNVVRLGVDEDRRTCPPSSSSRNLSITIYKHDEQIQSMNEQTSDLSPLTPPPPSPSPSPNAATVHNPVSPLSVPTEVAHASAPPKSSSPSRLNGVSTPISSVSTPAKSAHSSQTTKNNSKSHARRREEGHIKRPSNAFILFRTSFVANRFIPSTIESHSQNLSRIAGQVWRGLSASGKAPWMEKAKEVKREHERMHPGYAYRPTESYALRGRRKVLKGRGEREEREARRRCEKIAELVKKGKASDELEKAVQTSEPGDTMKIEMEVNVVTSPVKTKNGRPRARRTKQPTTSLLTVQQPKTQAEVEAQKLDENRPISWPPRDASLIPPTADVIPSFASAFASFSPAPAGLPPGSFSSAEPSADSRSLSVEMLDDMGFDVVGVEMLTVDVPAEMDVDKEWPDTLACTHIGTGDADSAPPAAPETSATPAERDESGEDDPNAILASAPSPHYRSHSHSSHSSRSSPSHSSHSPFSSRIPRPPLFNLPNTFIPPGQEDITFVPSFSSVYLPPPTIDGEKGKEKGVAVRLPPMKDPFDQPSTLGTTARETSFWTLPAFGTGAATATTSASLDSNMSTTKPSTFSLPSKVLSSFPGALRVPDKPRLKGFGSNGSSNNGNNGRRPSWSMSGVATSTTNGNGDKDPSQSAGKTSTNININGTRSAFNSYSGSTLASAGILPSKVRRYGTCAPASSSTSALAAEMTIPRHERAPASPSTHERMSHGGKQSPTFSVQETPVSRPVSRKHWRLGDRELEPEPESRLEEVGPTRFPPRLRRRHHRLGISRPTTTFPLVNIGADDGDSAAFNAPAFRRWRGETDGDRDLESESSVGFQLRL